MEDLNWLLAAVAAIFVGAGLGWVFYGIWRAHIVKNAEAEGAEIIDEARDRAEIIDLELKEAFAEIEEQVWTKEEKHINNLEEQIAELQELADEKAEKFNQKIQSLADKSKNQEEGIKKLEAQQKAFEGRLNERKKSAHEINQELIKEICAKVNLTREEAVAKIIADLENETHQHSKKTIANRELEAKEHSELLAKEVISRALARFHRAYCPERGIPSVYFEEEHQRKVLCDPDGANIKLISELTGCDIIVEPEKTLVAVLGYDPVRRELTRRVLERILKEKKPVNVDFVRRAHDNIKRELLATIKRDGDNIAKELKLDNVHPEIRQMMGSLRYRYSFTQNQHFHCGEVGWLCGLLAQELGGTDMKSARRSGLLHDLGKALDHEMDGGHAVIGANFITARGEKPDIIHAVKSHHYDEQPASDMAYLVIAADAISGARPGARRSTTESYEQKVNDLEAIAKSFHGVTDCFVLNGGRELRVLVNSKAVDDLKALKISREMAQRIENECSYPGQIKVVVVRETLVYENTRGH